MTSSVIHIERLYKKYRLGVIGHGYLVRDLQSWWARFRGKEDPNSLLRGKFSPDSKDHANHAVNSHAQNFWALKDINLSVQSGDILGIIGRNGAGKSTLLKIISRVTAPTEGIVRLKGRVGSLLEVGTGFHPELTGRENIYLNGSILGMSTDEIKKKFDEIVSFAEVEKFLDTPVKRYSSGMHVRLAFAVAAHLEPEILLVDEVLAVGDARFQKKCLGKMQSVSSAGTTVLFVSHNMSVINSLCSRCVLIRDGRIAEDGQTADVILSYYNAGISSPAKFDLVKEQKIVGDDYLTLLAGCVTDFSDNEKSQVEIEDSLKIKMRFEVLQKSKYRYLPNFHFHASNGQYAFISTPSKPQQLDPGIYTVECQIPGNLMNDDTYFVGLAITSFDAGVRVHFYEQSCLSFVIRDSMKQREWFGNKIPGIVRPKLHWHTNREP